MKKVDVVKREVWELVCDLSVNTVELKQAGGRIDRVLELLTARTEIYKSIAHRQRQIIDLLEGRDEREAA